MRIKGKYKTIIAAILLVLYAFTATPVSYWHHHKSICEKNNTKQHSQVVEGSNGVVDANCKICSHHYSIALNDAITVYISPITFFNKGSDFHLIKKITNPGYGQSNKGPPSAA